MQTGTPAPTFRLLQLPGCHVELLHRPSDKSVSNPVHIYRLFLLSLAAFMKHTALNGFDPNRNESLGQLLNEESVVCPLLRGTCTVERRG